MLKNEYKKLMDQISPSTELVKKVLEKKNKRGQLRPVFALALIAVLVFPVMAGQIPAVCEGLFDLDYAFLNRFLPVSLSDTCNGITVEVCGLIEQDDESLIPGPGVILLFEYEDGSPVKEELEVENIYFDGYSTWEIMQIMSFVVPEREERMLLVCIQNPDTSLEELEGVVTTILIDSMIIEDTEVEGPWKISFRFTEELKWVEPVEG